MSIEITCLQCGTTRKVNDRLAGKRVRCPECDTAVHVPELAVGVESVEAEVVEAEPVEAEIIEAQPIEVEPVDVDVKAVPVAESAADAALATGAALAAGGSGGAPPSSDWDDDDDSAIPRRVVDEDELDMTSMVDVTFLLLIFFVVTASFQLQKSIMMPRQQTDAPSTSAVEEDPEELDQVELQIDERGAFLVLAADWEAETPGKQNLISKLKEALGDSETKLIIKVQEQAKLQSLVDGMDAGTIAGYTEIEVTQVEDFD